MYKRMITVALATALSAPVANAGLFDFSYTLESGSVLAGQLEGNLQDDNNTIVVDSFLDFVTFNGTGDISLPSIHPASEENGFNDSESLPPVVTLDGIFMDIAVFSEGEEEGFVFTAGTDFDDPVLNDAYFSSPRFGSEAEEFDDSRWNMSIANNSSPVTVPLPSTLPLFLIGAFGLAAAHRRTRLNTA